MRRGRGVNHGERESEADGVEVGVREQTETRWGCSPRWRVSNSSMAACSLASRTHHLGARPAIEAGGRCGCCEFVATCSVALSASSASCWLVRCVSRALISRNCFRSSTVPRAGGEGAPWGPPGPAAPGPAAAASPMPDALGDGTLVGRGVLGAEAESRFKRLPAPPDASCDVAGRALSGGAKGS